MGRGRGRRRKKKEEKKRKREREVGEGGIREECERKGQREKRTDKDRT